MRIVGLFLEPKKLRTDNLECGSTHDTGLDCHIKRVLAPRDGLAPL